MSGEKADGQCAVFAFVAYEFECLRCGCWQESEERSRIAISQAGHGPRGPMGSDMDGVQTRLPALQVLGADDVRGHGRPGCGTGIVYRDAVVWVRLCHMGISEWEMCPRSRWWG